MLKWPVLGCSSRRFCLSTVFLSVILVSFVFGCEKEIEYTGRRGNILDRLLYAAVSIGHVGSTGHALDVLKNAECFS